MGLVISVLYLCLFLAAGILAVRRVLPGEGLALYLPLGCAAAVTLLAGLPALFALVSVARKLGVDAEEALTRAGERFTERFARMEELAADWDKPLHALSPEQQMELWDRAKRG